MEKEKVKIKEDNDNNKTCSCFIINSSTDIIINNNTQQLFLPQQ